MPAYYEKEYRYWRAVFRTKMRDGTVKQFTKRGFRTKKEAEAYIQEQKKVMETDLGMTVATFIKEKYMPDIKTKVKERTYMTKEHMIKTHVLNMSIAKMSMNEVKAQDIIQWQNSILEYGYSDCYNRTLNNQIVAIFLHAVNFMTCQNRPVKGFSKSAKRMQKSR